MYSDIFQFSVMVFCRKPLKTRVFVSSCPRNQPVVSVRFSHQFRESLLKAVFSRLYGSYFRPEKTELHRGSPSFYTKSRMSEKSAEVRELLYQVAKVREVREVPGGYGPPTLVVFV